MKVHVSSAYNDPSDSFNYNIRICIDACIHRTHACSVHRHLLTTCKFKTCEETECPIDKA